jgi:uncharacterized protein DUF2490
VSRAGLLLLLLFLFGVPSSAHGQTVVDHRFWLTPIAQGRFHHESPWRWSAEMSIRTRDGISAMDIIIARGLVGYDVTKTSSLWAGYGEVTTFLAAGGYQHEHRLFQQHLWSGPARGATLSVRTRFEERDVDGNSNWSFRVREQVRYSQVLGHGPFLIIGWDEIAFHANTTSRYARGFDQNRAFIGVGRTIRTRSRLEVGYLNHYLHSLGAPNRMNHVLATTVNVAF